MSSLKMYKFFLHGLLKLARLCPQTIEIKPRTIINIWVPIEITNDTSEQRKKPTIMFIHDFGLDGILTRHFQALALAKDYPIYVSNLVFFGGSITDKTDKSVKFQAKCMAKGLRKLGVEKCTLVCLIYGGWRRKFWNWLRPYMEKDGI